MIHHPSPIKRLIETVSFFRVYGWQLGRGFVVLYLPMIVLNLLLPGMAEDAQERAGMIGLSYMVHFLYQPIYTGALIYWLARIEAGENWSLKEGFIVGISLWDKLIVVNLISHLLIVLGVLAFIVPGLIAYSRLALAEFRVVLNSESAQTAVRGSFVMTRAFTWEILASSGIMFLFFLTLELVFGQINRAMGGGMATDLLFSSLLSVVLLINLTILLFRFYGLAKGRDVNPRDLKPE